MRGEACAERRRDGRMTKGLKLWDYLIVSDYADAYGY